MKNLFIKITTNLQNILKGGVVLLLFSNTVLAETSWTTGAYENDADLSQTLSIASATSLEVNVFGNTERNYDYIYIYDKDGNELKKLHGDNLDETFIVAVDSIRVRLKADSVVTRSGVTVSIKDNSNKGALENGTADSILIRFTDSNQDQRDNNINQLEQALNQLVTTSAPVTLTFVEYNSQFNTTIINLSRPVVHDTIYQLVLKDYVAYSEPNVVFSINSTTFEPNDPYYIGFDDGAIRKEQWHYKAFTNANSGINLPKAWAITTGSVDSREVDGNNNPIENITVAVIDTGITEHVDLTDNMLKDNGSVYGYDFLYNDSNPIGTRSHATHVAGTIAAKSNNSTGVSGVNWQAKILPIRVLGKDLVNTPKQYALDMSNAIIWAAGGHIDGAKKDNVHPAKVINMSIRTSVQCSNPYVGNFEKSTVQNAINIATNLGATIVVSAGNNGRDSSNQTPANCENVISVGATDQLGNRSVWRGGYESNYGTKVDVSAPGSNIWSTIPTDRYAGQDGTSMATPHVSGVVSLMLAQNPDLSPAQVEVIIKKSVNAFPVNSTCTNDKTRVATSTQKYCGTGIIDAYQAVVNSKTTLLTLGNAKPVKKSKYGQTLYKFKYLDTDGYSGVKEYSINFNRTAGVIRLYIKKNGLPDANDSNSYDCNVVYNGNSENNNEVSIKSCLEDIKIAYGDLLYIQIKVSNISNDTQVVGTISVRKTHPPVWSGNLDVGKSRTHTIVSVHKKKDAFLYNDLALKLTLTEVSGTVIINIKKVTLNGTERTISSTQRACIADENGSCSINVTLKYNEIAHVEVKNTGSNQTNYKVALDAETNAAQLGQVEVTKGNNKSTDWWSYTHQNLSTANGDSSDASNGPRIVKVTLTGVNKDILTADLDLYTKLYATNGDIANNDITTTSGFNCRPYLGGYAIETCKIQYNKDSTNNVDEKVRIRVRGYYASDTEDKTVEFKIITRTSRHIAY